MAYTKWRSSMKNLGIFIWFLFWSTSFNLAIDFYNPHSAFRRTILLSLSESQLKLKAILDSENEIIEDERLLTGNILAGLLRLDPGYAQKYEQKAKTLLVKIYNQVRSQERKIFPSGTWKGIQGQLNGRVLLRYVIEELNGWELTRELKDEINARWFTQVKLSSMLTEAFGNSPLKAMKFAYPDKFWVPDNWDKEFIWFDHDFSPRGIWKDPAWDGYVRQLIRYYIERVMGWEVDKSLAENVTRTWFSSIGLGSMLVTKFNGLPLEAIKFAYPEKFADGTLHESDFIKVTPEEEIGITTPIALSSRNGWGVNIGSIFYSFGPSYEGYQVARLSEDFGGLFDRRGVVIKIFPLLTDFSRTCIDVVREGLLFDPEEFGFQMYSLQSQFGETASPRLTRVLTSLQELGIEVYQLTLRERINMALAVEDGNLDRIKDFYYNFGLEGIKVLANLPSCELCFHLARRYPEDAQRIFHNYVEILELAERVKSMFGQNAPGYVQAPEELYYYHT
jgi:hypothetical protein